MLLTHANRILFTTARRSAFHLSQRTFAAATASQIQSASPREHIYQQSNLAWLAAAAGVVGATALTLEKNKADCCGIAGVVGAKGDAR